MRRTRSKDTETRQPRTRIPEGIRFRWLQSQYRMLGQSLHALPASARDTEHVRARLLEKRKTIAREIAAVASNLPSVSTPRMISSDPSLGKNRGVSYTRREEWRASHPRRRTHCAALEGVAEVERHAPQAFASGAGFSHDLETIQVASVWATRLGCELSHAAPGAPIYFHLGTVYSFLFPAPECSSTLEYSFVASGAGYTTLAPVPTAELLPAQMHWSIGVGVYEDTGGGFPNGFPTLDYFTSVASLDGYYADDTPVSSPSDLNMNIPVLLPATTVTGEMDVPADRQTRLFVALHAHGHLYSGAATMPKESNHVVLSAPYGADALGVAYRTEDKGLEKGRPPRR